MLGWAKPGLMLICWILEVAAEVSVFGTKAIIILHVTWLHSIDCCVVECACYRGLCDIANVTPRSDCVYCRKVRGGTTYGAIVAWQVQLGSSNHNKRC